jgi:cytochrome c-type biogenesis protein CcmH
MPLFWFFAGALTTLATLVVLLPWLRKSPRFGSLPALPWQVSVIAVVLMAAILGYGLLGHSSVPQTGAQSAANVPGNSSNAFTTAAKVFADSTGGGPGAAAKLSGNLADASAKTSAGSMNSAIANLESRLAKGGGSDGDWELLAKSFEFLGRPADAAKARARQLPTVPKDADAPAGSAAPMASNSSSASGAATTPGAAMSGTVPGGTAVSGEIMLAPALKARASAGETLFIVAKSVDTPGVPVAVFRGSVGNWPLKFTLDDSQSMLPGRNLSSAGRVTIEARISQKGQPLPATGDLQGSSGVVNPADHQPLKITIDRVIS